MSVQVENLEKNMAKLTIEVDVSTVEKALESAYKKNKKKINVPGFRKGKVPRAMIEKMYGPAIFYEDAVNEMIPPAYAEAAEECELDIVSQPSIDIVQIEKGKPFIFTAEVAVKPEVTLGEYKGVEIEKINVEVTDEEVEAEVNKERESNARTISVDDRAVENGDITIIDFEGFKDGQPFEGGKAENYTLTIGSGAFIPGFEEQLVGANIGEEVTISVTFPEEYQEKSLAGQPAEFKVTVKEIKVKEYPELDDDFAQDVSEFDTLAEYKEDVRKTLMEQKEKEADSKREEAVLDKVIENAQMDIPDLMVETQTRQLAEDFARRISQQGLSVEQYFQFTGLTPETFLEQMKPQALRRIQSRLVLEKAAEVENIQISEEKFNEELENMAKAYQTDIDKFKEMMGEEEEKQIRDDLAVMEALKLMKESAKEV
ncbi:MAG: trigger factor [Lachnospiraceae bacterium]|nr:trigger factor [Lachnospiraceae bacterium]